jgi:trehalose/maltose transport system substrate-binding protein
VEPDGTVRLNNPANIAALKRAAAWIGSISPSGVPLYHESDVENLWRAGQAAFIGAWVNMSKVHDIPVGGDSLQFEVAPVPAGPKGHFGVLGDMSLAISKYAANRDLAIQAIQEFTGETVQRQRLLNFGVIPTRVALFQAPETFRYTLLRNPMARQTLNSIAARPSTVLGAKYEDVSRDISASLNAVLFRHETAEAALSGLQTRIERVVQSR